MIEKNKYWINNFLFKVLGSVSLCLLILAIFLNQQIQSLKKNNLKNKSILNQALPGFSASAIGVFNHEVGDLEAKLKELSGIFDSTEQWAKKEYDLSIYFVQELDRIKQLLNEKAKQKQLSYPELNFKEKLPTEKESSYL